MFEYASYPALELSVDSAAPPDERLLPMELSRGAEVLPYVHASIEAFKDFAAGLPIGDETRAAFNEMLTSFTSRADAIQLFAASRRTAGLVPETLFYGPDKTTYRPVRPDQFLMELTPWEVDKAIADKYDAFMEATGVSVEREVSVKLAFADIVGHELAHGLEEMYSHCQRSTVVVVGVLGARRRLSGDTLDRGIVERVPVPAQPVPSERIIQSERFSTGLGREFALHEMVRLGVVAADDLGRLTMVRQLHHAFWQGERFRTVQRIVDGVPAGQADELQRRLKEAKLTINFLGYGRALDMQTIHRVLALTP